MTDNMEFLSRSYFKFFEGREYTEIRTFLIITQEAIQVLSSNMIPNAGWTFMKRSAKYLTS
jgi:hypothetical protein